jgi:hypothetical protein
MFVAPCLRIAELVVQVLHLVLLKCVEIVFKKTVSIFVTYMCIPAYSTPLFVSFVVLRIPYMKGR